MTEYIELNYDETDGLELDVEITPDVLNSDKLFLYGSTTEGDRIKMSILWTEKTIQEAINEYDEYYENEPDEYQNIQFYNGKSFALKAYGEKTFGGYSSTDAIIELGKVGETGLMLKLIIFPIPQLKGKSLLFPVYVKGINDFRDYGKGTYGWDKIIPIDKLVDISTSEDTPFDYSKIMGYLKVNVKNPKDFPSLDDPSTFNEDEGAGELFYNIISDVKPDDTYYSIKERYNIRKKPLGKEFLSEIKELEKKQKKFIKKIDWIQESNFLNELNDAISGLTGVYQDEEDDEDESPIASPAKASPTKANSASSEGNTTIETASSVKLDKLETQIREANRIFNELLAIYNSDKTEENKNNATMAKSVLKTLMKKYEELQSQMKIGKGIDNPDLYEKAKQIADATYKKPSAYKSGFIVRKYKELGGTYSGKKGNKGIGRWFKEEWKDIGNSTYPVYRPTKRISKDTPLTPQEIKPSNLKKQIALKQVIKGDSNLPPFKGAGLNVDNFSNYEKAKKNAIKYLGKKVDFKISDKKDKKFMVFNPEKNKWIYFGQMGYEDFLKHQDPVRRNSYLKRTANIKGDWKDDKYSPNNLARNILW